MSFPPGHSNYRGVSNSSAAGREQQQQQQQHQHQHQQQKQSQQRRIEQQQQQEHQQQQLMDYDVMPQHEQYDDYQDEEEDYYAQGLVVVGPGGVVGAGGGPQDEYTYVSGNTTGTSAAAAASLGGYMSEGDRRKMIQNMLLQEDIENRRRQLQEQREYLAASYANANYHQHHHRFSEQQSVYLDNTTTNTTTTTNEDDDDSQQQQQPQHEALLQGQPPQHSMYAGSAAASWQQQQHQQQHPMYDPEDPTNSPHAGMDISYSSSTTRSFHQPLQYLTAATAAAATSSSLQQQRPNIRQQRQQQQQHTLLLSQTSENSLDVTRHSPTTPMDSSTSLAHQQQQQQHQLQLLSHYPYDAGIHGGVASDEYHDSATTTTMMPPHNRRRGSGGSTTSDQEIGTLGGGRIVPGGGGSSSTGGMISSPSQQQQQYNNNNNMNYSMMMMGNNTMFLHHPESGSAAIMTNTSDRAMSQSTGSQFPRLGRSSSTAMGGTSGGSSITATSARGCSSYPHRPKGIVDRSSSSLHHLHPEMMNPLNIGGMMSSNNNNPYLDPSYYGPEGDDSDLFLSSTNVAATAAPIEFTRPRSYHLHHEYTLPPTQNTGIGGAGIGGAGGIMIGAGGHHVAEQHHQIRQDEQLSSFSDRGGIRPGRLQANPMRLQQQQQRSPPHHQHQRHHQQQRHHHHQVLPVLGGDSLMGTVRGNSNVSSASVAVKWERIVEGSDLVKIEDRRHVHDTLFLAYALMKTRPLSTEAIKKKKPQRAKNQDEEPECTVAMCCKYCDGEDKDGMYVRTSFKSLLSGRLGTKNFDDSILKHCRLKCEKCPLDVRAMIIRIKDQEEKKNEEEERIRSSGMQETKGKKYGSRKGFFKIIWERLLEASSRNRLAESAAAAAAAAAPVVSEAAAESAVAPAESAVAAPTAAVGGEYEVNRNMSPFSADKWNIMLQSNTFLTLDEYGMVDDSIFLAMSQMKVCRKTAQDDASSLDIGVCCKHCDHSSSGKSGRFFAKSMDQLLQSSLFDDMVKHVSSECRYCPNEIRDAMFAIQQLEKNNTLQNKNDKKKRAIFWEHPKKEFCLRIYKRIAADGTGSKEGVAAAAAASEIKKEEEEEDKERSSTNFGALDDFSMVATASREENLKRKSQNATEKMEDKTKKQRTSTGVDKKKNDNDNENKDCCIM